MHGLNGVDDYDIRFGLHDRITDRFRIVSRQEIETFGIDAEPLRTQLDLPRRFLAGDIQHRMLLAEMLTDLQQKRTFSDARFAAQQHNRAFDQTAAENAVQLGHAGIISDVLVRSDLRQFPDLRGQIRCPARIARADAAACSDGHLRQRFLDRIPCAAVRAASVPFRILCAAGGALIMGSCFCHVRFLPYRCPADRFS